MKRLLTLLLLLAGTTDAVADNWPAWRGPTGDGVCREAGVPLIWNKASGVLWTAPLPVWGDSTPAIWGDALFVTSHTDDKLLLMKFDKRQGTLLWTREVTTGEKARLPQPNPDAPPRTQQKFHDLHNLATPSPVTDGKTVVVHFGNGDLAAYDYAGKQLWKRNLQDDYGRYTVWWGHANSPVIVDDLVISVCMQDSLADVRPESPAGSYVVAHEVLSGVERWKTERNTGAPGEEGDAYTTPLLIENQGQRQLMIMGGNQLDAYLPATGEQVWRLPGMVGGRTVTGPAFADGLAVATRGMRGAMFALRVPPPTAKPVELTTRDLAWKYTTGTPDSCSPVIAGNWLFYVADDGIARCLDLPSGNVKWKQRLKGDYKASPIVAEGRVYFLSTSGVCTVVSASDRFEKLAENTLDDSFLASPAVSDGRIYLRGRKALYCLGSAQ